ncbi:MAG: hypothetical protein NTX33_00510 [Propionibacteriales bacterium]|nr:hypothetical protein [Propionibacteriales bacterium]
MALASALTACSEDKKDPEPTATDSTTSAEPTPTESDWEDGYTGEQLTAFEAALQRWESYLNRSEPIFAEGNATAQAEDLFQDYFPDPLWRNEFALLQSYEDAKVITQGLPEVFWSKAAKISKSGLSVTIEQCVDFSSVKVTQDSQPVEGNKWTTTPHVREIQMEKPDGYGWLIYSHGDPSGTKKRCDPEAG